MSHLFWTYTSVVALGHNGSPHFHFATAGVFLFMGVQTIFKITRRERGFVIIDNKIVENPRLSWKAKGLLCYLLSRPETWRIAFADLANRATDGETAARSALLELEKEGYVVRTESRAQEGGKFAGVRYEVFEEPRIEDTGSPLLGFPQAGEPDAGNLLLSNTQGSKKEESPEELKLDEQSEKFVDAFLALLIRTDAKITSPTPSARRQWALAYRRLVTLDGKTKEEIWAVCVWARNDGFWKRNFLSPCKLRDKKDGVSYFDRLQIQMKTPHATSQTANSRRLGQNSNLAAFEEYERNQSQVAAGL